MMLALSSCPATPDIVETGCSRSTNNWVGDGHSTLLFADMVSRFGGSVTSCDIDPAAIHRCARSLAECAAASPRVVLHCMDSVRFLQAYSAPIDLLYLDSLDFDGSNVTASMEHHLQEAKAALGKLTGDAVVVIDDCGLEGGGKGAMAVPFLVSQGFRVAFEGYQAVLTRAGGASGHC